MSNTIIEKLYALGDTVTGKAYRMLGARLRGSGVVEPLQADGFGSLHVNPDPPRNVSHYNGTATTTAAEITFPTTSREVLIQNTATSAADDLLVSFDGGTTFKTLKRLAAISVGVKLNSIWVKSSVGTVAYEAVVTRD